MNGCSSVSCGGTWLSQSSDFNLIQLLQEEARPYRPTSVSDPTCAFAAEWAQTSAASPRNPVESFCIEVEAVVHNAYNDT